MTEREWRLVERTFVRAIQTLIRTHERTGHAPRMIAEEILSDRDLRAQIRKATDDWLNSQGLAEEPERGVCGLSREDERAVMYLLDLLCEHEEAVVMCATLDDVITRDSEKDPRPVMRSRRIFRRAQRIIKQLQAHLNSAVSSQLSATAQGGKP